MFEIIRLANEMEFANQEKANDIKRQSNKTMILFLNSVHGPSTFKVRKFTLEMTKVVNNGLVGPVCDILSSSIVEAKYTYIFYQLFEFFITSAVHECFIIIEGIVKGHKT